MTYIAFLGGVVVCLKLSFSISASLFLLIHQLLSSSSWFVFFCFTFPSHLSSCPCFSFLRWRDVSDGPSSLFSQFGSICVMFFSPANVTPAHVHLFLFYLSPYIFIFLELHTILSVCVSICLSEDRLSVFKTPIWLTHKRLSFFSVVESFSFHLSFFNPLPRIFVHIFTL